MAPTHTPEKIKKHEVPIFETVQDTLINKVKVRSLAKWLP